MHATDLVQLAANLASIGYAFETDPVAQLGDTAHAYWLAHRFRCDAWHQRISRHRSGIEGCGTSQRGRMWREIMPTLEEILVSEPLTRVIAYLARQMEKRGVDGDWGALTHGALANHVQARHRCLNLMVFGHGLPVEKAVGLNRLRRLAEFFNDQLLGALPPQSDLEHYAFEVSLVARAQRDYRCYAMSGPCQQVRLVTLSTAVRGLISSDHRLLSANPRLNENIAQAALAMLPATTFDSFGVARSRVELAVARTVTDSPVASGDFEHPLAPPFDLLAQHLRSPKAKATRRF